MGLASASYAALALLAEDWRVFFAIKEFPFLIVLLLLALSATNYILRFFRWHLYLRTLQVNLPVWRSFLIFMAGFTMTVSPAKTGEAIKAYFLRVHEGQSWSKGLAVVFAERLTDLLGVFLLLVVSMHVFHGAKKAVIVVAVLLCAVLGMVYVRRIWAIFFRLMEKIPFLGRKTQGFINLYSHTRALFSGRNVALGTAISIVAWFAESLALYVAVKSLGASLDVMRATFVYALAILAGAISALPGGLLATEGSMAGLLVLFGLGRHQSASTTFVVRLCTLWFAVILGLAFLLLLQRGWHPRALLQDVPEQDCRV